MVIIEHDYIPVQYIQHVGRVVCSIATILDFDILEISHRIECGVAIQAAVFTVLSLDLKVLQKISDGVFHPVCLGDWLAHLRQIGILHYRLAMRHGHRGYRLQADE